MDCVESFILENRQRALTKTKWGSSAYNICFVVTSWASHEVTRRPGTQRAATQIQLDIGHCLLTITLLVTLCSNAVADWLVPLFPLSRRFHVPPLRISIGDNVGETGGMERTASSPGGPDACHDDVCGPDGSCCSRLCSNVVDFEASRRITKRHRRRLNLTEGRKSYIRRQRECANRSDNSQARCLGPAAE